MRYQTTVAAGCALTALLLSIAAFPKSGAHAAIEHYAPPVQRATATPKAQPQSQSFYEEGLRVATNALQLHRELLQAIHDAFSKNRKISPTDSGWQAEFSRILKQFNEQADIIDGLRPPRQFKVTGQLMRKQSASIRKMTKNLKEGWESRDFTQFSTGHDEMDTGADLLRILSAVLILESDNPRTSDGYVSRDDFGPDWPLTIRDGIVYCRYMGIDNRHVVVIDRAGKTYALGPQARDSKQYLPMDSMLIKKAKSTAVAELVLFGNALCPPTY
jgi:hypothetical protein